jgi:acyl carrier protein
MNAQSTIESEVADLIVSSLNLEKDPAAIVPEQALFGAGLGLDSIDALELAMAISQRYGFKLRSDDPDNDRIFASLAALSSHVERNRTK